MNDTGFFLFSLDTELATGYFDHDLARHKLFSPDGSRERQSIQRILALFNEYKITGTWAVVGHLFHSQCEHCEICPMKNWQGKFSSYEEVYGTDHPLWYGSDVVEAILKSEVPQEIGCHGYSHEVFDENQMSYQKAKIEIQEWLRVAKLRIITPYAMVFPRNVVGHLEVLKEAGFMSYRGQPDTPFLQKNKTLGPYLKIIDHLLTLSKIPIYDLNPQESHGLVNLRASQNFFDINRKVELFLDSLNLQDLRMRRVIKGIHRAAQEKKIIHIWSHPWEFRTEKDFMKLRFILEAVSQEIKNGRLRSVSMTEMTGIIRQQKVDIDRV